MHSSLTRDWNNGMQHTIPVSANFTVLNYINLNATFNFTDRTYFRKTMQSWDGSKVVNDTVYGLYNIYNWSMSLSASTKLYGFLKPGPKFPMLLTSVPRAMAITRPIREPMPTVASRL